MAHFFSGRQFRGRTRLVYGGERGYVSCEITDYWEPISSTTSACGATSNYQVTQRVGLSESDTRSLESVIEASLGSEAIGQLKSSIKETVQHETRWELAKEETQGFSFTAPECGRQTNIVYQLVREYSVLNVLFKRLLRRQRTWTVALRELLPAFHVQPNIEPWIPDCRCSRPRVRDFDGAGDLDFGRVGLQVPYSEADDGHELILQTSAVLTQLGPSGRANVRVRSDELPDVAVWLGAIGDGWAQGEFALTDEGDLKTPTALNEYALGSNAEDEGEGPVAESAFGAG